MKSSGHRNGWAIRILTAFCGVIAAGERVQAQIGACCLTNGTCLQTDSSGCTAVSGTFRGQGLNCFSSTCIGPCCTPDRDCFEGSENDCAAADGDFAGYGQLCEFVCPLTVETAFTYQGQLRSGGLPVNGSVDLEFALFTFAEDGDLIGTPIRLQNVSVTNGLFSVSLNFGVNAFDGRPRSLEVRVRSPHDPGDTGPFTALTPRQSILPAPYALALPGLRTEAVDGPPNVIGGSHHNMVTPGAHGAFIGGGGAVEVHRNQVTGDFGVVTGGRLNTAEGFGFVGGGQNNFAKSFGAVVGGDLNSAGGSFAAVGGGQANSAGGSNATVAGGDNNSASATRAAVGGGFFNAASGADSMIPGGNRNAAGGSFSFAAGRKAKVRTAAQVGGGDTDGDQGTFVWADSTDADFQSTGPNQFLLRAGGGVGIGTNAPEAPLHVFSGSAGSVTALTGSTAVLESAGSGNYLSLLGPAGSERALIFGEPGRNVAGGIVFDSSPVADGLQFLTNGNVSRMSLDASGRLGIGTTAPAVALDISSVGAAARISGTGNTGGVLQLVQPNAGLATDIGRVSFSSGAFGANPSTRAEITYAKDTNESLRFTFSTVSGLTSTVERMRILQNGRVGIGTSAPDTLLSVNGTANFTGFVGFGVTAPDTPVDAARSGGTVGAFNRLTNDGTVVAIQQDGVNEGTISVSGTTVSYNAFTGSHYAWTDRSIERGALVSMNGTNRRLGNREGSEVVYGIDITARANDPACLGVYHGLEESTLEAGPTNPHLVAAVGNGEMWTVDAGAADIEPGDGLISAATPGCAMKDDPRKYDVGFVIARAAERVRWSDVLKGEDGLRRKKISVLFGSYARVNPSEVAARVRALEAQLQQQMSAIEELRAKLGRFEAKASVTDMNVGGATR